MKKLNKKFSVLSKEELSSINGGEAITFASIMGAIGTAYGIYEAGKLCINVGIWAGNKIFRNNVNYL